MQKVYTVLFLIFFLLVSNISNAQRIIRGSVRDTLGAPLKSVNVKLISDDDTLNYITDDAGLYKFYNIKSDEIFLHFSMLGFKSKSQIIKIGDGNSLIEVPKVYLKSIDKVIDGVNILKIVPMVNNGDTIQFNFGAFKFRENSLLEEALKDLPGFQVYRDGSVSYNGKQILKVRVDNKDFFGGDLLTATRNLPAEFIKNIQLINISSLFDDGILREDSDKVLNITLKEDRKKIYFGQVTAGAGNQNRYLGSFGWNRFDEGEELSVLGSFNNTNSNLFTFGNPIGGDRIKSTSDIGDFGEPIDGLNTVSSIGVNIANKLNDIIYFTGSYNYVYQRNITNGYSQLTSTYIDNIINKIDNYSLMTTDRNHRIRFGLDMNFKNKDVLKINGNLFFNQQEINQVKESSFMNMRGISTGDYSDTVSKINPNAELDFYYSKYFQKPGRKLISNLLFNFNGQSKSESVLENYLEYIWPDLLDPASTFNQSQYISQRNRSNVNKLTLSFIEPIHIDGLLEFSYEFDFTSIATVRTVEDRLSNSINRYIDSLKVDYDYIFRSHKGLMAYQYEPNKKLKVNVGFALQPFEMKGRLPIDGIIYVYKNVNIIPSANLIYKFSKEMDWQFNYRGKNNQPLFHQILPIVDNTNSRNIIIGNPELKAEYVHRLSTTFRNSRSSRMQYFETNFAFNFVIDKIVGDKRSLSNSIIQETTFKNTTGYYDWRWYYTFNTPFLIDNLQLDLTGTTDYYNNLSFIDERKRTTRQFIFNQALQFKYSLDDVFETSLHSNYLWNQAKFDIPYKTNIDIQSMFVGIGAKGYLNNNFAVGLEMSQRFNNGYKDAKLNVNQTLMNSFIEFTFLKNKAALLRLQAFDLFNQNINSGIISEYIGNDVYEARNNRLGRYFMLSLNIRMQRVPKSN